jgi:hypothetical protein
MNLPSVRSCSYRTSPKAPLSQNYAQPYEDDDDDGDEYDGYIDHTI